MSEHENPDILDGSPEPQEATDLSLWFSSLKQKALKEAARKEKEQHSSEEPKGSWADEETPTNGKESAGEEYSKYMFERALLDLLLKINAKLEPVSEYCAEMLNQINHIKIMKTPVQYASKIEQIRDLFPIPLVKMVTITEEQEAIIIKPVQYLGAEIFSKVMKIVTHVGGEYVSAGKNSHWEIPKI